MSFRISVSGPAADLWIDDLALLCRGPCPAPAYPLGAEPPSSRRDRSLSPPTSVRRI